MAGEYCTGRMLLQQPHELLRAKKEKASKNQPKNALQKQKTKNNNNKKIKPLNWNQKTHAKILPTGNTFQIELKDIIWIQNITAFKKISKKVRRLNSNH